jgi:hypothetical protein
MSRLGDLLGSTKANIVEALALSERPLTCYRISKMYNMNVAKGYIAMKKLAALGLVRPSEGRGGVEYLLADDDLRRLALRLSSRVVTFEAWKSREAKRARFRSGLSRVPLLPLGRPTKSVGKKPTRIPGELENLALLARRKFDAKYGRTSDGAYDRI